MTEVITGLELAIAGQAPPTSLAPPAESYRHRPDTVLQGTPVSHHDKSKPTATKKGPASPGSSRFNPGRPGSRCARPPATRGDAKYPNPKLFLDGSIAGGVLSLIGIPLVSIFALRAATNQNAGGMSPLQIRRGSRR